MFRGTHWLRNDAKSRTSRWISLGVVISDSSGPPHVHSARGDGRLLATVAMAYLIEAHGQMS